MSAREREALLGFGQDHTIPAVPSAMLSSNAREAEYVRKALLGNSFSCPVVAWLLSHLLYDNKLITRKPSLTELSLGVPLQPAAVAPEPSVLPAEAPAVTAGVAALVGPEETLPYLMPAISKAVVPNVSFVLSLLLCKCPSLPF